MLVTSREPSRLCHVISQLRQNGDYKAANEILDQAAAHLDDRNLLAFNSVLRNQMRPDDADRLLASAMVVRSVPSLVNIVASSRGPQMQPALMTFAERHSKADVNLLAYALQQKGCHSEARKLRKYARQT